MDLRGKIHRKKSKLSNRIEEECFAYKIKNRNNFQPGYNVIPGHYKFDFYRISNGKPKYLSSGTSLYIYTIQTESTMVENYNSWTYWFNEKYSADRINKTNQEGLFK